MNTPHSRWMLAGAIALVTLGATPMSQATEPAPGLRVDCKQRYIRQAEVARLTGSHNAWQTFHRRQRIYAAVARACAKRREAGVPAQATLRLAF